MVFEFDRDTVVTPLGDGRYDAELAPGWVVGGGVNGGYLLAIIGNAVRAEIAATGHTDPFAVSAHYVSASVAGPAQVLTEVIRTTGRFSTVRAVLSQEVDGAPVPRIVSHATFGDLDRAHDAASDAAAAALGLAIQ